jgi:hypothetical protein
MSARPWYERDTMGGPGDAPPLVCVACKGDNNARLTPDGLCEDCAEEQAPESVARPVGPCNDCGDLGALVAGLCCDCEVAS